MADEFDKEDKQKEIDDFFDKFDRISNVFDKSLNRMEQHNSESDKELNLKDSGDPEVTPVVTPEQSSELKTNKTRLERLSKSKPQNIFSSKLGTSKKDEFSQGAMGSSENGSMKTNGEEPMTTHKKKKKYTVNKKQLFKFVALVFLGIFLVMSGIIISIIVKTPAIEPDNIYSHLSENSVLYDDEENIVDSLLTSEGLRTNLS